MPIGASKVGALGGLVPGGSETFNASGTFSVPPGVKKVSITGAGATGNPGNAGNQGNPGNPGGGGGGGSGSAVSGPTCYIRGGCSWKAGPGGYQGSQLWFPPPVQGFNNSTWLTQGARNAGQSGQAGNSGNAGTAGNPGNPGNAGGQSSGLTYTFCGGAGGNAGAGGAAGNAGTGGNGGGAASGNSGGSGGNGGGSGGNGNPCFGISTAVVGGKGGGGAGAVNSGQSGQSGFFTQPNPAYNPKPLGGTGNATGPLPTSSLPSYPGLSTSHQGGNGGGSNRYGGLAININTDNFQCAHMPPGGYQSGLSGRFGTPNINPACARPQIFRAGGGGGSSATTNFVNPGPKPAPGAGGGGGGRGNAGGSGGPTPTPSGSAATPVTHNCVPVTPGGCYPITVASPGGSVVISWNPQ